MRVSGARDIQASVVVRPKDHAWPLRLFIGVHRYCLTVDEAIELARQLVETAEVLRALRESDDVDEGER